MRKQGVGRSKILQQSDIGPSVATHARFRRMRQGGVGTHPGDGDCREPPGAEEAGMSQNRSVCTVMKGLTP